MNRQHHEIRDPAPARDGRGQGRHAWRGVARKGAFALGGFVAVALGLGAAGCAAPPESIVAEVEGALASGDLERLDAAVTADSRPLLAAMRAAAIADRSPLQAHAPRRPSRIVAVSPAGTGAVALDLEDDRGRSEWVVRQEGGRWRLDLAASATRRPFLGL